MIYVKDMPHLKVFPSRVNLPVISSDDPTKKGNVVFLNNKTLDANLEFITSKKVFSNNKYNYYYMDFYFKGKFFTKAYRVNLKKKRLEEYKDIKSKNRRLTMVKDITAIKGKNVLYDLRYHNELFFKNTVGRNFKLRTKSYANYIRDIISDENRLSGFKDKIMYIKINDWVTDVDNLDNKKFAISNPIFIFFYLMKWDFETFKALGDIDILIHNGIKTLRLNPTLCDEKKSWRLFKIELNKLSNGIIPVEEESEEELVKIEDTKSEAKAIAIDKINTLTGKRDEDEANTNIPEDSDKELEVDLIEKEDILSPEEEFAYNASEEIVETTSDLKEEDENATPEELYNAINDTMGNKEFISMVKDLNTKNKSIKSLERDKKLKEEYKKIKLNNSSLDDVVKEAEKASKAKIPTRTVASRIKSVNKNSANLKYPEFDKKYITEVMQADYLNAFRALENKSIPLTIIDYTIEDTSDNLTLKDTIKVTMEDSNRVRHAVVVDVPKIVDNKFMYIGGNKQIIYKQKFPYPIIKTGPDEVQICTNYNKIFINRYGTRITESVEKLNGLLNSETKANIQRGNSTDVNKKYITSFEYDEVASKIVRIKLTNYDFIFSIPLIISEYNAEVKDSQIPIGYDKKNKKVIYMNTDTQRVEDTDNTLIEYLVDKLSITDQELFNNAKTGTKFMHSRATIMKKHVPLVLLLSFCESLSVLLRKANIKHRFSDKRPSDVGSRERVIRFNDGYFIYTADKFATELLMNGLIAIPTRAYNYTDFDNKDTYTEIFLSMYGTRIIGNALDNFYECLIDPKTKEILDYLDYPNDFTSLILYGNELLSDNNHIPEDSMEQFRIRSFEMIPSMLYKGVADAYSTYRLTANNNNPVKVSLPRNYLLDKINELQVVENYSDINPITELEKDRTITTKGHSGLNLARAYTIDKRTYSPTMKGTYALSTSPDANVGVSRFLTMEPAIENIYGMVDIKPDEELKDVNLFSPGELLSPLGASSDDPIRTSMALKQSKHLLAVDKSSPVLISNGVEETVPYHLSKDFVVVAEDDGEVIDMNEDVAICKYRNSDTTQAIDLRPRVVKNSGGGFFLSYTYTMNFKKGEKFKKDDIIAQDSKFFTNSKNTGIRMNIGTLEKVAIKPTPMTIEDSAEVTTKICKDMASEIIKKVTVVIPKTSNVDFVIKEKQHVKTGDILVKFDNSTSDAEISKFLANVGEDLKEEIISLSKNNIKAKVSGYIEKVDLTCTVDLDDLTPSLAKVVNDHYKKNKKFISNIDKHLKTEEKTHVYRAGLILNDNVTKTEVDGIGKIKGELVGEGVLLEFYIKYKDYMGLADKGTFFTALKFEVSNIIPEGYEPYSEYRPNEEISSFIGTSAIIARKTPSIETTLAANKLIVELKRKLWEIYYGKKWE